MSQIPTHGIPSPHHSPGPALSVDSAAALTPINDVVRKSSSERQAKCEILKGKARGKKQKERWDEHEGMQANQMQVEKGGDSCEGRDGKPKNKTKRSAIAYHAPDFSVPVFFA
jgi:hypothetical protein